MDGAATVLRRVLRRSGQDGAGRVVQDPEPVVESLEEILEVPGAVQTRARWWPDALRRRMLALADLTAALTACAVVTGSAPELVWAAAYAPMWLVLGKLVGNYDRDHRAIRHLTIDETVPLLAWAGLGTVGLSLFDSLTPVGELTSGEMVQISLVAFAVAFCMRVAVRGLWRWLTPRERTVLIGRGDPASAIRRKLGLFRDAHLDLVREVDPLRPDLRLEDGGDDPSVLALLGDADRVIVALPQIDAGQIAALSALCREGEIKLNVVCPLRGMALPTTRITQVADLPLFEFNTCDVSRSTLGLKRIFDLILGATLLLLAAPLLIIIALMVKLDSRGPVLFTQVRVGRGGRPFRLLKFRTMSADAEQRLPEVVALDELDPPMFKLRSDPRVTRAGRFLRRLSLDELPQLVNVLLGRMSMVGPRPEQMELVRRYRPDQRRRLVVKPGITGPMQVHGRGNLDFDERLVAELDYVENVSLARDLRLLALTVPAVLHQRGAF